MPLNQYSRQHLIIKFLPLVENIARKFSTSQQASGVMTILDLIQSGSLGLVQAAEKLDYEKWEKSDDLEKTIKSFFSKRIKGSIRRQTNKNRGTMRIPEHKINGIRKNFDKDTKLQLIGKEEVKSAIGRSPDFSDALAMRMYYELKPQGKYFVQ